MVLAPIGSNDGIVAPTSILAYPHTRVRFILGAMDCGIPALLYYESITSDHDIDFPIDTPHDIFSTAAGLAAAKRAVQEACVAY